MANTYTLIASNTLTGTATSVTFNSIPSTYTDLLLKVSARGAEPFVYIKFNGDGVTTKYSSTYFRGNGSTVISNRNSSGDVIPFYGGENLNTYTSNTFSNLEIYIPSYTVSQNKPLSALTAAENNNSAVNYISATAGLYTSTSAISSITLDMGGVSTFDTNSSFYLYGIKNS